MADAHALVIEAFQSRLAHSPLLEGMDEREAVRLGREAAESVLGPLVWRALLGEDRLDTTQAARLLGISRQAVHKRVRAHSLLGVPGRGTTWFPAWQFDVHQARVRSVVPVLLGAWQEAAEGELDPQALLAWACLGQAELGDDTPAEWIALGKPDAEVVSAARQAARALTA